MKVDEYISGQPEKRQEILKEFRKVILDTLPENMTEVFNKSLISYQLPLSEYPKTYNKQPLMYLGLANRSSNLTLTLTSIYNDPKLREEFIELMKEHNPKIVTKNSCIKFKKLDDIPLMGLKKILKKMNTKKFVKNYENLINQ